MGGEQLRLFQAGRPVHDRVDTDALTDQSHTRRRIQEEIQCARTSARGSRNNQHGGASHGFQFSPCSGGILLFVGMSAECDDYCTFGAASGCLVGKPETKAHSQWSLREASYQKWHACSVEWVHVSLNILVGRRVSRPVKKPGQARRCSSIAVLQTHFPIG
jgi:hypothetical protein